MHARLRILLGAQEPASRRRSIRTSRRTSRAWPRRCDLRYVVITSVNRDDLADGGSRHFAETVRAVRAALPEARVEVLTPDFLGDLDAVARVLDAAPHVFNHNMETVARLYQRVRPQADYRQSLDVLRFAKQLSPGRLTKSGLMVGLGETPDEVQAASARSARRRCRRRDDRPVSAAHAPQSARGRYVPPAQFDAYREFGLSLGFKMVFSGPLVRSSYMADMVKNKREPGAVISAVRLSCWS